MVQASLDLESDSDVKPKRDLFTVHTVYIIYCVLTS